MDIREKASIKKRLIDANGLIKEANADGAYGYVDAKQIADAPTVDAVEVVHGRWISSHDEFCACSICKYPFYVGWNQANYCPNCGAKMDGGAN